MNTLTPNSKDQLWSLFPFPRVPDSDHMGQVFQCFSFNKYLTVPLKDITVKWQQVYAVP